ncbi:3-oxoacyl-ACP reductase [Salininema proteolyticum]|uniref:3-oxoacyl-ACP reductase n=1 Tax=Salininema proteolyticum TaxID=1607685 RepID=A0ABV8U152_9ACTN
MADRYVRFVNSKTGKGLAKRLGLPPAAPLRRFRPGEDEFIATAAIGGDGRARAAIEKSLKGRGIAVPETGDGRLGGLVFDATGLRNGADLDELYDFFHGRLSRLEKCGRVLILAAGLEDSDDTDFQVAQTALEGFTRSLGKEVVPGATAQLARIPRGAEAHVDAVVGFFLSRRSAFVSGQILALEAREETAGGGLEGQTAVVTGAAGGIGRETVKVLSNYGARVVCVDIPAAEAGLKAVAEEHGGIALPLDITDGEAGDRIAAAAPDGIDALIHNAGVTRDKTLARMDEKRWDSVLAINLKGPQAITQKFLDDGVLNDGARVVVLSSVSGIAGNRGQTNYGASKAGLVGLTRALAPTMRERGGSFNAVAPGLIETPMTAAMPAMTRAVARRLSSLGQGGQPVDVAEAVSWLALPGTAAVNGQVLRVCGQNLMGA